MKCTVELSVFFVSDITAVEAYISQFSESAFSRFKNMLSRCIDNIRDMPMMYAAYPFAPEYRHVVIDKYVMIYRYIEKENKVSIYRLLHGAQNIPEYL